MTFLIFIVAEFEEEMGSEEESGKDWSELEEEAARGELKILYLICMENFFLLSFAVLVLHRMKAAINSLKRLSST